MLFHNVKQHGSNLKKLFMNKHGNLGQIEGFHVQHKK